MLRRRKLYSKVFRRHSLASRVNWHKRFGWICCNHLHGRSVSSVKKNVCRSREGRKPEQSNNIAACRPDTGQRSWDYARCWCSGFLRNDVMQPLSSQRLGKHVPAATIEERCFLRGPCRAVILKTTGPRKQQQKNGVSYVVRAEELFWRQLGHASNNRRTVFPTWSVLSSYFEDNWATKSVLSGEFTSAWEAVKRGPERVKLKNLHC
jgi:ferredoxin-thioredoxin reductase catalytic subunit